MKEKVNRIKVIIECSSCDHEYINLGTIAGDYGDVLTIRVDELKEALASIPVECPEHSCGMPFNTSQVWIQIVTTEVEIEIELDEDEDLP